MRFTNLAKTVQVHTRPKQSEVKGTTCGVTLFLEESVAGLVQSIEDDFLSFSFEKTHERL